MRLSRDDLTDFIKTQEINHIRAYNLSKEAVIFYTIIHCESMIQKNLRMNSISPSAVSTGILKDFTDAFGQKVINNINRAGRPGTAQEIA